jgi:purine nucleoside permease
MVAMSTITAEAFIEPIHPPGMTVDLRALVLPAFDDLAGLPGEAAPWRTRYDLDRAMRIEGVPSPLRYTDRGGVGVVPTGVGKTAAATTTTALGASEALDLDDALVLSVGVAGGPPELSIGSVVIADSIVDWDDKCRFDPVPDAESPGDALALNPYTDDAGVFALDDALVDSSRSVARGVELRSASEAVAPSIVVGTNLCGDELWHGRQLAEQAAWVADARDKGPCLATEMEDVGTATALQRFDRFEQYLSVRGISNHDRPTSQRPAAESFFDPAFEAGFEVGIENAVRVARAIVDDRLS